MRGTGIAGRERDEMNTEGKSHDNYGFHEKGSDLPESE